MVSFIYECLGEVFHGSVIASFLYLRKGSEEVRREIRTAARLIVTFPFEEIVCTIPPGNKFDYLDKLISITIASWPAEAIRQHQ